MKLVTSGVGNPLNWGFAVLSAYALNIQVFFVSASFKLTKDFCVLSCALLLRM